MRSRIIAFWLCTLAGATCAFASEVKFIRVWPGWRDAESFERISEFFSGKENTGGQTVLRSQPAARAGFYFLTRASNPGAPVAGAKLVIEVIRPASPRPATYTFPAALPSGSHVFQIGLTGDDWPDKKAQPVAWRLRALGPDGRLLAEQKSFLWKPDAAP